MERKVLHRGMKTFHEWLEKKNEGILPFLGANHHGPLGYQIGKHLEKGSSGGSAPPSGPGIVFKAAGKVFDYWRDRSIKSRVKKLIAMGLSEEDAVNFANSEIHDPGFKTHETTWGPPRFDYYKKKYPNAFAGDAGK